MVRRRKTVEQRLEQGRSTPVPLDISKAESNLEAKLIWRYLGSEPPIHLRRTLDQFGYPNLRSTVARDDDQMLWKRTRKVIDLDDEVDDSNLSTRSRKPKPFTDGKIIMVDQMWLWIVDQKTVVTFFPSQEATTSEEKLYEQSNLHSSIYNELNGDLARRFETAGDLAALITLHAVTVLLDRTLHHDLQVLQIFEESISILVRHSTPERITCSNMANIHSDRMGNQILQTLPQPRLHRQTHRPQQKLRRQANERRRARPARPTNNRREPRGSLYITGTPRYHRRTGDHLQAFGPASNNNQNHGYLP